MTVIEIISLMAVIATAFRCLSLRFRYVDLVQCQHRPADLGLIRRFCLLRGGFVYFKVPVVYNGMHYFVATKTPANIHQRFCC